MLGNCPFCGGEAARATPHPHDSYPAEHIFCTKCRASAPTEEAWNRRAAFSFPEILMIWIKIDDRLTEIRGKECLITIEPRPAYCDRGNFIAKLFPTGDLVYEIDEADGWPRYYFDETRAKLEIEAWLTKRGQAVELLKE